MEKEKRKPRYVLKDTKLSQEPKLPNPPSEVVQVPKPVQPESRQQLDRRPPPRLEQAKKKSYIQRRASQPEELCMVCSQRIKAVEAIWSCKQCYQFMHLACIKKWIFNLNKDNKKRAKYNWTCPQCIFEYCEELPEYYCFCGKYRNPEQESGVAAHSCGSYCERKRGFYCQHPCPDLCHRGRCRPCTEEGIEITCGCGKSKMKTNCSDEKQTFVCGRKCEKPLNCQKHNCNQNCHDGFCNPCSYKHLASCYCGKNESVVDCVEVSYQCDDACGKKLDCGVHLCQERCHKGPCKGCARKPQVQKTCPCGQYSITMLADKIRQSCTDPIPVCGMPCKKTLVCGHSCSTSCHEGKCPPCKIEVVQRCSCESANRKAQCWQLYDNSNSFVCERVCKRRKSCGQHYCNKECCQFRNSNNNRDHECLLVCQKQLNCNKHTCGMPCHFGNCARCPVLYSQPQPCPCGRTFLRAPVVCGTIVPECQNHCDKVMECGHVCYLSCHYGACKCHEKVVVECQCGKNKIQTTCGRQVLCTEKCQKALPCGHICGRQCHSESCFDPTTFDGCNKICSKVRAPCGHLCNDRCHTKRGCTDTPCRTEVSVKCECGTRVKLVECGATTNRIDRHIQCNRTCQNMKRFQVLYKQRSIYYPPGLVYFGMKNLSFLQKVQDNIYNFIRTGEPSLHIDFSRFSGINNAKYHFSTLFEKHYFLDVTFYHNKKSMFFTLATTKNTMLPQPSLSKYIAMLESGEIKKNTVPFTASLKFSQLPKEKLDLFDIVLTEFAHHYYSQRKDKTQYFHFWLEEHANDAAKLLREKFPNIALAIELTKPKDDIENVEADEIVEELAAEQNKEEEIPSTQPGKPIQIIQVSDGPGEVPKPTSTEAATELSADIAKLPEVPKPEEEKPAPKVEPKKPDILLKSKKYPPSSEWVQFIYEIDEDDLYEQVKDWDDYIQRILPKEIGVEASEWRIRSLIVLRALFPLKEDPTKQLILKLLNLYKQEQARARRFLSIRNIEIKKTKEVLAESDIIISGNEPEIVNYHILLNPENNPNTSLTDELLQTSEVHSAHDILHSLESNNHQTYFKTLQQCDYLIACAIVPYLDQMRLASINELIGKLGGRMESLQHFWNSLFFDSEDAFVDFLRHNRMKIVTKESKKLGRECSYIMRIKEGEEELVVESVSGKSRELRFSEKLLAKRDVKYAFGDRPEQLWKDRYCLKSYFAFGDHKSTNYDYESILVRSLRRK